MLLDGACFDSPRWTVCGGVDALAGARLWWFTGSQHDDAGNARQGSGGGHLTVPGGATFGWLRSLAVCRARDPQMCVATRRFSGRSHGHNTTIDTIRVQEGIASTDFIDAHRSSFAPCVAIWLGAGSSCCVEIVPLARRTVRSGCWPPHDSMAYEVPVKDSFGGVSLAPT